MWFFSTQSWQLWIQLGSVLDHIRISYTFFFLRKWAAAWQNQQNDTCTQQRLRSTLAFALNDHPVWSPSLIKAFAVCMKKHWVLGYPSCAQQRLWSVFDECTGHFVGFVMQQLNYCGLAIIIQNGFSDYRKNPKNLDTRKHCSKNWTMWICCRVMCSNSADGMAPIVDSDQSSLIWVYTVCSGLSDRKFRTITVTRIWGWTLSPKV